MPNSCLTWIPIALFVLGCQAPGALAQPAGGAGERLHAHALDSLRQARFSEAYGRFVGLADAGHAPSARMALWMYLNGRSRFGKEWDASQEQLTAWAELAGQPVPTLVAATYPATVVSAARPRR